MNLVPGSLGDQLEPGPTLLVFLRHFGCIFCREAVSDLREAADSDGSYPRVLFFAQAGTSEIRAFLRRYWPTARAIADPALELYEAFEIGRASFYQALGPKVFQAKRRAQAKGHENGTASGDIWRLPGVLVAHEGRIVWSYKPTHAADHPDFAGIPAALPALG